jgi:hypothetical protein
VPLTKREGAVLTAFTGKMIGSFSDFHEYAEEILERPIMTHEFGWPDVWEPLKERSRPDFIRICEEIE